MLRSVGIFLVLCCFLLPVAADSVPKQKTVKVQLVDAQHPMVMDGKPRGGMSAKCPKTGRIAYIESNAQQIVIFDSKGRVELICNPAKNLNLEEYRVREKSRGLTVVEFHRDGALLWGYNNTQFGAIDVSSGEVEFHGQD